MIPQDFIDELLSRTDIVDIVQSRVTLKKQGKDWMGLCPFHDEKSPSFSVSQDKQFFYCFGCQASGTALDFVKDFDRVDFPAAVEILANRAGMEVPRTGPAESPERAQRRKSIYEILEQSSQFYRDQLRRHPDRDRAVEYLKGRGLSGEVARDYGLGFAPPGWDNLYSSLAKTNLERDLLIESGMVVDVPEEKKTYDRFRDRVMFPIRDNRGRAIAFGGRIIGDGKPKYLNSPETPVFHKGRELYGLYEARRLSRQLDQLIIVEGYMDVVALAQHGVTCAVATLGTATTEDHLDRIFRIVSRVTFCFDGDEAGRNAAWKALRLSLSFMRDGRSVRFLFLPDGEDPDTMIRREGRDGFEARLDAAPAIDDVFFERLGEPIDLATLEGKANLASQAMPLIQTIPGGVFKELVIDRLAAATNLDRERLLDSFSGPVQQDNRAAAPPEPTSAPPWAEDAEESGDWAPPAPADPVIDRALTMLLQSPEIAGQFDPELCNTLEKVPNCTLLVQVMRCIIEHDLRSPALLLAAFQDTPEFGRLCSLAEAESLLSVEEFPGEFGGIVRSLMRRLENQSIQEVIKSLAAKRPGELSAADRELLNSLTRQRNNRG